MENLKPVRNVVIVGGGAAGWITAGTIAARHSQKTPNGVRVTLVESPNVPILGVGEGTWPTMRDTLRRMGISETEFVRTCNVGFKQGAWFANWVTNEVGEGYYHPLVLPNGFLQGNLVPSWQFEKNKFKSFAHAACSQAEVCDLGLAPKQYATPEFAAVQNYAYHLDAGAFAEFLKNHCVDNLGVRHVLADVDGINTDDSGDIESVATQQKGDINGDLFVDCTGFKSLLLGEHFGVGFKPCNDVLFIDKAIAVQLPNKDENSPVATHTISTGQKAGWIWDIGLSTRRGVGHVYSSNHNSEENALKELQAYIDQTGYSLEDLSPKFIDIKSGYREKFWARNCVAVGLSAGFLEPLEASALVLVELSSRMIAEQMPVNRQAMEIVSKRFNRKFEYRWKRIIDFLKLHYVLTKRSDSQFWIDNVSEESIPDTLKEMLDLWKHQPPFHDDFDYKDEVFPSASYQYVLYGMGFETENSYLGTSEQERMFAKAQFDFNSGMIGKLAAGLPSHRDLLNHIKSHGLPRA